MKNWLKMNPGDSVQQWQQQPQRQQQLQEPERQQPKQSVKELADKLVQKQSKLNKLMVIAALKRKANEQLQIRLLSIKNKYVID